MESATAHAQSNQQLSNDDVDTTHSQPSQPSQPKPQCCASTCLKGQRMVSRAELDRMCRPLPQLAERFLALI
jgi:hypothetical protein